MPFIQENLEIIVAGSAIVTLILIYIFIKKAKERKKEEIIDDYNDIEVVEDIYAEEIKEREDKKLHRIIEDLKSSSSTFGAQETSSQEALPSTSQNLNPHRKVDTVEVPPHDKIVKDNFKEFAGLKILVAEDNLINQKVIAGLLNESGIELTFANDGLEAISFLHNQKEFDIILMDAHMPNMDGFEATRKIRQNPDYDTIPIVALSGDIASDDIKKMYDAGMDAHLEKPLKMDALYDILYAFTKKESSPASSKTQLNTNIGIEISGGDESFYKEILNEFLKDYEDADKKIKTLLESGQREKADALLLDLVGITANIGADKTNAAVIALKKALQNLQTGEYKEAYKDFSSSFERLIEEIKAYTNNKQPTA